MLKKLLAGAALAGLLGAASQASALTYVSQLEYRDGAAGAQTPSFGTVTIDELVGGTSVKVTVELTNPNSLFVNTGGPHDPFLFNLVGAGSTVAVDNNVAGQQFTYDGAGSFTATPFGTFTNKIGCCGGEKKKGAANGDPPPLIFTVTNLGGLTFGGAGAIYDADHKLITPGTGNRFASNVGGFLFAADIYDATAGRTYNVAAKDAYCTSCGGGSESGVPEPATWALMILGFGGAGATLRRRRVAVATA
jgi:hypothetical protein